MDCPRVGKWFGGCRFEGRYDVMGSERYGAFMPFAEFKISGDAKAVKDALNQRTPHTTYVRDVCTRCGRTIERETSSGGAA